jgi:hypothetical protein
MVKSITIILIVVALFGSIASASAHLYFFGITELAVNQRNQHIEIIHQFIVHDVETAISLEHDIRFSAEHPNYERLIRQYFEKNFKIMHNNQSINPLWVGLEVNQQQLFVYQELLSPNFLAGLVVKNSLLVDTYAKQINTVNYIHGELAGSLTYDITKQVAEIKSDK